MKSVILASLVALLASAFIGTAEESKTLKVGDPAPKITGKDENGKAWDLGKALKKKNVLLYFYPKDETPGCTKEACGLRDRIGDLQKANVEVVGVSFDNGESHKKFIATHNLNFKLLQDTDGKIADAFGARMPGKPMARRVSFLIGKDGTIKHITDTPKADVHLEEMKDAVAKLTAK
jgi:peroxiredoxin Q/BCP